MNQPSPDKQMLSVRIGRPFYLRLVKAAREHKLSLADFITHLIVKATKHIELTTEDYEKIARDTREFVKRRHVARRAGVAGKAGKTGGQNAK